MTRVWVDGLPLEVQPNKHNEPAIFILNERRYIVRRIVQRWEVDTDWWTEEGRAWRRHYAITTRGDSMLCVISYDVLTDEWQLDRMYD